MNREPPWTTVPPWPEALPPRWAELALGRLLPSGDVAAITGDLLEQYREVVIPERGTLGANLWYLRQVLSLLLRVVTGTKLGEISDRWLGVGLGLLIALVIVLTNVVLPSVGFDLADPDLDSPPFMGLLFAAFAACGFFVRRRRQSFGAPFRAGLIVAFCSLLIATFTFFLVYNVFIDMVGQQSETIASFRHSHDASLRTHLNLGLAKSLYLFLPILTVLGGLCGFLGGLVGSLLAFVRSLLSGDRRL